MSDVELNINFCGFTGNKNVMSFSILNQHIRVKQEQKKQKNQDDLLHIFEFKVLNGNGENHLN